MAARGGQRIEAGLEGDARDTPTPGTVVRPHEVDAPTALDAAGDAAAGPALPGRSPARVLLVLDQPVLAGVVELALAHVHGRFRARVAPTPRPRPRCSGRGSPTSPWWTWTSPTARCWPAWATRRRPARRGCPWSP